MSEQGETKPDGERTSLLKRENEDPFVKISMIAQGILTFISILTVAGVLIFIKGDCDTPIRLWLLVWICSLSGTQILALLSTITIDYLDKEATAQKVIQWTSGILHILSLIFFVTWWLILGSIWYWTLDSCDDFYAGYVLTLVLLAVAYSFVGLLLCVGVGVCCTCLYRWGEQAGNQERRHEEVKENETL